MQQSDPGPELSDVFYDLEARGNYTIHRNREEVECRLKRSVLRVWRSDTGSVTVQ